MERTHAFKKHVTLGECLGGNIERDCVGTLTRADALRGVSALLCEQAQIASGSEHTATMEG